MTLYKNKYRVEITPLRNRDYASDGRYFITICTKNREHIFGKIEKGEIKLNKHGYVAEQCWFELIKNLVFVKITMNEKCKFV